MIRYNNFVLKTLFKNKLMIWISAYFIFFVVNVYNQTYYDENIIYTLVGFESMSELLVSDLLFKIIKFLINIYFLYEFFIYDLLNLCDEVLIRSGKVKWFIHKIFYITCLCFFVNLFMYVYIYFFTKFDLLFLIKLFFKDFVFFLLLLFIVFGFVFSKIKSSKFNLYYIILLCILFFLFFYYNIIVEYFNIMVIMLFLSFFGNIFLIKKNKTNY